MSDRRSLIDVSARNLDHLGFTQIASKSDDVDTGSGITYTIWKKDGEKFLVRAKEYVYKEQAPFGTEHVRDALKRDAWLMIYFDDRQKHYVFDPSTVWNVGDRTGGRSKRSNNRSWIEVPVTEGTLLEDFMRGDSPRGLDETDRELKNTSLFDFL